MGDYKKNDEFGNRMKAYEKSSETFLSLDSPIICRIDGKRFSKYTSKMVKPYDSNMVNCMVQTAKDLVDELHADFGYVQSDEITLIFLPKSDNGKVCIPFDGRVQKSTSIFAASATAFFLRNVKEEKILFAAEEEFKAGDIARFDCRIFNVPDVGEAVNSVLWRIQDCKKNFVSCVYRWRVGHAAMQKLSGKQMYADMLERGIDAKAEYPEQYRYGTVIFREKTEITGENGDVILRKKVAMATAKHFSKMSFENKIAFFDDLRHREPK